MARSEVTHPFSPPRAGLGSAGDIARPVTQSDVRRDLEHRGFEVTAGEAGELRAVRTRFHGELLTRIDTVVWVRRIPVVDAETVRADRERLAEWVRENQLPRFRSRMTVLAYHADRSTAEARALALAGPTMRSGRFHGLGIRDRDGIHAFRSVRLRGLAFFPLLNFLVLTTLAPQQRPEPRVVWVWAIILTLGQLPLVVVLGWIALTLARARGWWP